MLITTNQLVTQWGTVFGEEVLTAAILDRFAPPQSHSHDPGGQLSTETEEEDRVARQHDENDNSRLWTLPERWTHRTRPPLLGRPHRTRFPTAPAALIINS